MKIAECIRARFKDLAHRCIDGDSPLGGIVNTYTEGPATRPVPRPASGHPPEAEVNRVVGQAARLARRVDIQLSCYEQDSSNGVYFPDFGPARLGGFAAPLGGDSLADLLVEWVEGHTGIGDLEVLRDIEVMIRQIDRDLPENAYSIREFLEYVYAARRCLNIMDPRGSGWQRREYKHRWCLEPRHSELARL